MPGVSRITVEGFRSLRSVRDLELGPRVVLIGENGSGKSNFVEVFRMLEEWKAGRLDEYVARKGGANQLLFLGMEVTDRVQIQVQSGEEAYSFEAISTGNDSVMLESHHDALKDIVHSRQEKYQAVRDLGKLLSKNHNIFTPEGDVDVEFVNFYSRVVNLLQQLNTEIVYLNNEIDIAQNNYGINFSVIESFSVYRFHDTSSNAKSRLTAGIQDNEKLRTEGENLAAFLYRLQNSADERERHAFGRIEETVRIALSPFFDRFLLRPTPLNLDYIRLEWRQRGTDYPFTAAQLSDGSLRFILLTTALLQPLHLRPSTLLFDEPELGLHPRALTFLAEMVHSVSVETQVILATQSTTLVDEFDPADVRVVRREGDETVIEKMDEERLKVWLENYSLSDLVRMGVVGGTTTLA